MGGRDVTKLRTFGLKTAVGRLLTRPRRKDTPKTVSSVTAEVLLLLAACAGRSGGGAELPNAAVPCDV